MLVSLYRFEELDDISVPQLWQNFEFLFNPLLQLLRLLRILDILLDGLDGDDASSEDVQAEHDSSKATLANNSAQLVKSQTLSFVFRFLETEQRDRRSVVHFKFLFDISLDSPDFLVSFSLLHNLFFVFRQLL